MGIKVNMTEKEASAGVLEVIPAGWYKVTLSDCELLESKSAKNKGKPYYRLEFTVNEPEQYEGRKVWTNAMLFDGALYTISQIMKAMDLAVGGQVEIPEPEELIGQEFMAKVKITPERTVRDETTGEMKTYEERNDIAGFKKVGEQEVKVSQPVSPVEKKAASLLPS